MKKLYSLIMLTFLTSVSGFAANHFISVLPPREVEHMLVCHEGKFTLHDAIYQLNEQLTDKRGIIFSSVGVPGSVEKVEGVYIKAPFNVSAPMVFMNNSNTTAGPTPYACVTVSKWIPTPAK